MLSFNPDVNVKCSFCGNLHEIESETYIKVKGNLILGNLGELLGNSDWENFGVPLTCFCLTDCFLKGMTSVVNDYLPYIVVLYGNERTLEIKIPRWDSSILDVLNDVMDPYEVRLIVRDFEFVDSKDRIYNLSTPEKFVAFLKEWCIRNPSVGHPSALDKLLDVIYKM